MMTTMMIMMMIVLVVEVVMMMMVVIIMMVVVVIIMYFLRSSTSTTGTQISWSNCDFLACAPVLVGIRSGASNRNSVIAIRNLLNLCLDQQSDNICS